MSDDYRSIEHFIDVEEFEVGTYPGSPHDRVVHAGHLRSVVRDLSGNRVDIKIDGTVIGSPDDVLDALSRLSIGEAGT